MSNNVSVEDLMLKFLVSVIDSSREETNKRNLPRNVNSDQMLSCSFNSQYYSRDELVPTRTSASSSLPSPSFSPPLSTITTRSSLLNPVSREPLIDKYEDTQLMLSLDYEDLIRSYYQDISIIMTNEREMSEENSNHHLDERKHQQIIEENVQTSFSISKVVDSNSISETRTTSLNDNSTPNQPTAIHKTKKTVKRRSVLRRRASFAYDEQSTMQFYFPLWVFHQVSNKTSKKHF